MRVPWQFINRSHKCKSQYNKGAERKRRCLEVEEESVAISRKFSAYGRILEMVPSFKHLGKLLLAKDDNWSAVIRNLEKA